MVMLSGVSTVMVDVGIKSWFLDALMSAKSHGRNSVVFTSLRTEEKFLKK